MNIAVVSDDGTTVGQHFGRAAYYCVVTVDHGEVTARELRPKAGHVNFTSREISPDIKHRAMAEPLADCETLIAGGMGEGAVASLRSMGITAVLTDETDVDQAALRHAAGELPNLIDRVHRGRGRH